MENGLFVKLKKCEFHKTSGVGTVLSQCASTDDKVQPCAFFSRQLTPAEQNYDFGNWELLVVMLALQEYLQAAWWLNSRQERWAPFLDRFTHADWSHVAVYLWWTSLNPAGTTVVRCAVGRTEDFKVELRLHLHQGSALSCKKRT